jgi:glucose-1-phosphate adenylyltransferase
MPLLDNTLSIILAGGTGTPLAPLTEHRTKPAVPFGGKYRIIDFPLANCLHSGLRRILVLTQYKSHSLQKHLRDGWSIFNPELGEYITPVPPQMRVGDRWYTGTADAIYQNLYLLERSGAEQVLILPGDHIYRMDYAALLDNHQNTNADVTVACMKISRDDASEFGVVRIDAEQRITEFTEKPAEPAPLPDDSSISLVSMGIYVFSTELLREILHTDHADANSSHDIGRDILPRLTSTHRVMSYHFGGDVGRVTPDGYWSDVDTIDTFYKANMGLLEPVPSLNLYQDDWTIRTHQEQSAPARTVPGTSGNEGIFINSIIASGTVIAGGSVQQSILFPKVFVGDEAMVHDSILFNGVHVGAGAELKRCIIDKDVNVPENEKIGFDLDIDRERFTVSSSGVVVIPKGYQFG